MATAIASAAITDSIGVGTAFTSSTATFLVTCSKGSVRVQFQQGSEWFYVAAPSDKGAVAGYTIHAGTGVVIPRMETATNYRLVSMGEITTAGAFTLA